MNPFIDGYIRFIFLTVSFLSLFKYAFDLPYNCTIKCVILFVSFVLLVVADILLLILRGRIREKQN